MHSVICSLSIGIATINDMQRRMPGVLLTRAISLRSRMRGKLSCPVLKAGRRERSLLPSYQNGLHYRRDATMREDHAQLCMGHAPEMLAVLNNTVLGLFARQGASHVAHARREFAYHFDKALAAMGA